MPIRARVLSVLVCVISVALAAGQDQPVATPSFLEAARTVSASIQKDFHNEKSGLYAQSLTSRDPEFMWGNGVMFSSLVAAARHEPETYLPIMDRFFEALERHWDRAAAVPGYEPAPIGPSGAPGDKYYDDNQWMVLCFAEAFDQTHDRKYLDRAAETLRFSLSGWDETLGGGIWWHEKHKADGKNTCSNAPAAVACLRMARHSDSATHLNWARRIVGWTNQTLRDTDGLFLDHKRAADGHLDRRKFTYNAALMLRANLGLYRATREAEFLAEARRIGEASSHFVDPKTGAYRDSARFSHLLVEADLELFRNTRDEAILARARRVGEATFAKWRTSPPKSLLDQAGVARMLWLLADHETEVGRAFWAESDLPAPSRESGDRPKSP